MLTHFMQLNNNKKPNVAEINIIIPDDIARNT